ncbi:TRAP transporter large permease subunit [Chloroflexota bacterium]
MEWYTLAAIVFGALLICLAAGMPIVFCLGLVSLGAMFFLVDPITIRAMGIIAFTLGTNFVLIAVPLFILMAEVVMFSGLSEGGFDVINKWLGRLPGGLALSSIGGCAVFAAVTGSSVANTATIGTVAIPEMMKAGYDKKLATGSIAAGGALGILIPPSLLMIVYAVVTEQSLGHLFIGGVFPGILLAGLFMLYIAARSLINPKIAPRPARVSWKDRILSLYKILPVVGLIFLVLGTIYTGITTPTEAAAVGAFGAVMIATAYRRLTVRRMVGAMIKASETTCFVFFIMVAGSIMAFALSALEIPQGLVRWVIDLGLSRWIIMIAINVLYLILGCIMDPASIVVLTVPILFPIIIALGFDPIWFGVIVTINMEMANITPPLGFNLFVMKGISPPDVTLGDVIRGAMPFVICQALGLALCMIFPQLILWLPSKMLKLV